ncbi:LacI family DNA-binding transcriptional regulator [Sinorhizobium meliloti]|uniref:LacI family DNA-binding transcriptional regulator n=1 Tax=Rhizobium meliloti TaxID=382 RepID=UPI000406D92C|nr:LacI family DNA-binding transcriptional regulator [Sinorhizobium meliloti]MDW9358008.1 substrate-binding domain-containing protein [Sinorhizobium meliloti]MDW9460136.1 substrate-binding domain-containing protein [Sinorhizobium meliloti]MDW9657284.1 substrate-binding domain-containing protein [Sinorhizobium meliloti]MDW9917232.1 substrate-binding domain-containing protein [Sinorhizobium meliloti]MDW9942088.1 substrate-binding domain-containing protein [Sinorhizobium meliloti]
MAHPFLVKDIAFQAGLSTATVDRVLNGRRGVRRQTVMRVNAAIRELERQQAGLEVQGRKYAVDVVMEAPERFTEAVRKAFESEAATFMPTVFRSRFHFAETMRPQDISQLLDRIRLRGTDGVVLKAPDVPEIAAAVARLENAGVAVVTLVTDLPHSSRTAYAGADNRAAGETAAYLIGERFADRPATVLVTISSSRFRGEEEREIGFRRVLREKYPHIGVVEISEGHGRNEETGALALKAIASHPEINAAYSIGGGNRAVLDAFGQLQRGCVLFVAHDLDEDNLDLLRRGLVQFVLHHDLKTDVRMAFHAVLERRGALRASEKRHLSAVEVITPYNLPRI